jgi:hypothetical protein
MQLGIEVERVGAPDDPVEGSNVILICTSYWRPPTWFYYENGIETWHKLSKDFLKEPNAGILTLGPIHTIRNMTLIFTLLLFANLTYRRRYSKRN